MKNSRLQLIEHFQPRQNPRTLLRSKSVKGDQEQQGRISHGSTLKENRKRRSISITGTLIQLKPSENHLPSIHIQRSKKPLLTLNHRENILRISKKKTSQIIQFQPQRMSNGQHMQSQWEKENLETSQSCRNQGNKTISAKFPKNAALYTNHQIMSFPSQRFIENQSYTKGQLFQNSVNSTDEKNQNQNLFQSRKSFKQNHQFNSSCLTLEIKHKICQELQITILPTPKDELIAQIGVQVESIFQAEDNFFDEYIKFRTLKLNHFEEVQEKQHIINQLIHQSAQFTKNYQILAQNINKPPTDGRQKRIFSLGKQIQDAQANIQAALQKVHKVVRQSEAQLNFVIPNISMKKNELTLSIFHLGHALELSLEKMSKGFSFQNNGQKIDFDLKRSQKVHQRIMARILNQLTYLRKLDTNLQLKTSTFLEKYDHEISKFEQSYKKWQSLFYENRVLVYNFMRQIQKLPQVMIELFGFRQKQERQKSYCPEDEFQQYMSARCEQCYHTNKKIKFLQQTNENIQPILKSLQWLIRDGNKKKSCIEFI